MIIGRPTLNRLRAVVSTLHLCMKYPMGKEVGIIRTDQKMARQCSKECLKAGRRAPNHDRANNNELEDRRSWLAEDLKEILISPYKTKRTKICAALDRETKGRLIDFLIENRDVFARTSRDMLGKTRTYCVTAYLSSLELDWEKRSRRRQERKPNKKWQMCTNYKDLNKACLKDPYPLPSIDQLVDDTSRCGLLSFMMLILAITRLGCTFKMGPKPHSS
ncbi:hypothetical protein CR513_61945, partial [Mucuna pruriens]